MECQTLQRYLQDLVNEGYLWEFFLNPRLPLEVRVQRQLEAPVEHLGSTLVQYREVNTIFDNSPIEGTTTKERTLYVNEACRDSHPTIVTCLLHLTMGQSSSRKKIHMLYTSRTTMP